MSPAERTMLRTLIDRARRAQIQARGGYAAVEADARNLDRRLGTLAKPPTISTRQPPFNLEHAAILRAAGHTWREIASHLDCSHTVAQYWLDPAYRARHQEKCRRYARERYATRKKAA